MRLSLAAAALLLGLPAPAMAQRARAGSVSGTVLAAATGQPVPGAVVVLEGAVEGALVAPARGAFLARSITAVTDVHGAYRFDNLQPAAYRLVVRHLGFHPATVQVDLTQAAPFRVSVGLVVNPIRLEAMDVRAPSSAPYGRLATSADDLRVGRLAAEEVRDIAFLESDAAVLTHADVVEAVTLGETDVFRAVQRLPGVSARDDFTAALWTRGAPWGQTRVYVDGQPLFNPVHVIGVFAGLNPDAIGAASFHPGARSVSAGEGAAGVLDVTTRRPSRPGLAGLAELSVVSARGALDWASPGGRVGAMVAARRSYADLITRMAENFGVADSGSYVPYAFLDVTARFDADLGRGVALEASGMWEEDRVDGDVPGLLRDTHGSWGNRLGRVSLSLPVGGLRGRATVGMSDFKGELGPPPAANRFEVGDVPSHGATSNALRVTNGEMELAPDGNATSPRWSAGLGFAVTEQRYAGQYPRPYPAVVLPDTLALNERVDVAHGWVERRWGLGPHAALEAGLRAEVRRPMANTPALGLAPRLAVRATPPGWRVSFSAAAGRTWQYAQPIAPAGPSVGPDLYLTDVWLLAGDTIPAVRADIATLGAEAWLGRGWIASVNAYARHSTGVVVPEPGPGPINNQRPIFMPAVNRATGLEFSVRRLVGRWTASASYTLGRSEIETPSGLYPITYSYAASADRRHVLDAAAMMRVSQTTRVGAAFTFASGAPYTRFLLGLAAPSTGCDTLGTCGATDSAALYIESPNQQRAPSYLSLDLLLDWSKPVGGVQVGAWLQVRNVLNAANAVTYTGTVQQCTPSPPELVPVRAGVCDRFDRGLPIMPLAGVRIAF